jgi:hypothetical protein
MNSRRKNPPIGVTVIAALLLIAGALGLYGDATSFTTFAANHYDILWPVGVHILALVAGVFLLLGHNWARWLAVLWMAFHVAISYPSAGKIIGHSVFLLLFLWLLFFLTESRAWFRPVPLSPEP